MWWRPPSGLQITIAPYMQRIGDEIKALPYPYISHSVGMGMSGRNAVGGHWPIARNSPVPFYRCASGDFRPHELVSMHWCAWIPRPKMVVWESPLCHLMNATRMLI